MFPCPQGTCMCVQFIGPWGKFHEQQKGVYSGAGGAGGAYLEQSSQAMFPVVSLMVRSETKAGYSVSQGSRVCFSFCAVGKRGAKKMKARCSGSMPCLATQNSSNAVLLRKLCDFSRHSTMHYFLISPVISSAKQLCKL